MANKISGAEAGGGRGLYALTMKLLPCAAAARDFYQCLAAAAKGAGLMTGACDSSFFGLKECVFDPSPIWRGMTPPSYIISPLRGLAFCRRQEELTEIFLFARECLPKGGLFAFDLDNRPSPESGPEGLTRLAGSVAMEGCREAVISYSKSAPGGRSPLTMRIGVEKIADGGAVISKSYSTYSLGLFSVEEVGEIGQRSGFRESWLFGDFRAEPFERSCASQIWVFRKG